MPFDTFTSRLKEVALSTLALCRNRYGGNGLKVEQSIDKDIGWQPTFFLRPARFLILAVEVNDLIYPEALKVAAHDIVHFETPIAVYQACPLEAYQNDPKHGKINLLRRHGFGIITVDDDDVATIQHPCIPLAQHISLEELERELAGLNRVLKVQLKTAHQTYLANEGQGLQQAGQIVEALILSMAKQAARRGILPAGRLTDPLADIIDELYQARQFRSHRAALGSARDFIKEFRNTASHAPRSARQAMEKIKKCKKGFLDAIDVARKLRCVMQALGFPIRICTS
jgi:hypothetical protein